MSEKDRMLYEIIGSILRNEREKRDLTNVEVSKILDKKGVSISDTSLRRYESGDRKINSDTLEILCELYDLDSIEIMKQAQIKRLQAYGEKLHVIRESDPDPIRTIYGSDVADLIDLFLSLNDQGKDQAKILIKSLACNPDLKAPEK